MAESPSQKSAPEDIRRNFFDAAEKGREAALKVYLEKFPDAVTWHEQDTGCGWLALHYAASKNNASVAKILLEAGANPNAEDFNHSTALEFAAVSGSTAVLPLLLDAGADMSARGQQGETPADIALRLGKTDFIAVLDTYRQEAQRRLAENAAAAMTEGTEKPVTVGHALTFKPGSGTW